MYSQRTFRGTARARSATKKPAPFRTAMRTMSPFGIVLADPPAHVRHAPGDLLGAVELVVDQGHRRGSLAGGRPCRGASQGREYSSMTRPIARRQTGQKPTLSRVNMMQSAEDR